MHIAEQNDEYWMGKALALAKIATSKQEVPVGAILVNNQQIVATAYNLREKLNSPLAHAELIALQRGSQKLNSWRLIDCTLYVTLEPCVMCAGALVQARIQRLVYGAADPKGGGVKSLYEITQDSRLNHRLQVTSGVLAEECANLLKDFFKKRRM
jgi:tRNA(adenine34) deaminase